MASEDARSAQVEAYHKALLAAAEAQRIAERDAKLAAEKAQRAYDRDLAILEEFRGEVSYVVIIVVQRVSRLDCPNRVFNYDPLFFLFFCVGVCTSYSEYCLFFCTTQMSSSSLP